MYKLITYTDKLGADVFLRWLDGLKDVRAKARISARLIRLENGNFGDCRAVGEGVWELKIDTGPGYRVYYAIEHNRVVLLCDGGTKNTQKADIGRAIDRWMEWKARAKS
jgi:putative addiction module killer protein